MKYLFLVLLLAGCENGDFEKIGHREAENLPSSWKSYVSPGNHIVYLIPTTMNDGTRCVVLTSNGSRGGISCDWEKARGQR